MPRCNDQSSVAQMFILLGSIAADLAIFKSLMQAKDVQADVLEIPGLTAVLLVGAAVPLVVASLGYYYGSRNEVRSLRRQQVSDLWQQLAEGAARDLEAGHPVPATPGEALAMDNEQALLAGMRDHDGEYKSDAASAEAEEAPGAAEVTEVIGDQEMVLPRAFLKSPGIQGTETLHLALVGVAALAAIAISCAGGVKYSAEEQVTDTVDNVVKILNASWMASAAVAVLHGVVAGLMYGLRACATSRAEREVHAEAQTEWDAGRRGFSQ